MKETNGEKAIGWINIVLLIIIALITLYPLIYILSASFSSGDAYRRGDVLLLPSEATVAAYKNVLSDMNIWKAYANTVVYTAVGTVVSLVLTIMGAYPLSKKYLPGAKIITKFIVCTMWINPGIIPFYLTLKEYGILNTRFAIIIAFAITTFNAVLLKNFFEAVPDALEEAARIDGANDLMILLKIILPLSVPALATIGLFYGVSRWNGYFWAMIILRDDSKIPLQVFLKKLIVDVSAKNEYASISSSQKYSSETIIYSTIVVSVLPVIIVYPYIQKFFVKGVMVGAVKG